jgi:hypothetical protein
LSSLIVGNRKVFGHWHHIYITIDMKATQTNTTELIKNIDKQLKAILKRDIRKIDNGNVRCAAFLQLIAA